MTRAVLIVAPGSAADGALVTTEQEVVLPGPTPGLTDATTALVTQLQVGTSRYRLALADGATTTDAVHALIHAHPDTIARIEEPLSPADPLGERP